MDIAGLTPGLTLSHQEIGLIAGGLFAVAVALLWFRGVLIRRTLFKLCGVPTSSYRLVGSSLVWPSRPVKLTKDNLSGVPSSVFLKKNGKTAYVCQYNPRNFNGRAKVRERYQVLLLMGMVLEKYKPENIKGAVCYQDHLEPMKYEPVIFKQLIDLQNEYKEAIKEWETPDTRPLFNRDQDF